MSQITRNAAPAAHPCLALIHRFRYMLAGGILVVVAVLAWFSDDLGALFARQATAADITGTWTYDPAAFAKLIDETLGDQAPAEMTRPFRQYARQVGDTYKDTTYIFAANAYTVCKGSQRREIPCTYEPVLVHAIRVTPSAPGGSGSLILLIDQAKGTVFIQQQDLRIPLRKAE